MTLMVSSAATLVESECVPPAPDNDVAPETGTVDVLTALPGVAVPAVVTVPPLKPSAAKAVVFELVTVTPPALSFSVILPPLMVDAVEVPEI